MNSQLIITCSAFVGILALALTFYTKQKDIDKKLKKSFIILLFIILVVFAYALSSSPDDVNSSPMVVSLMPDKMSPQEAGTTIKWTGAALDLEKDPIQYKFLLDGQQKTDWSYDHTWSWITSSADVRSHTIEVKVKDGNHNADGDDSKNVDFSISHENVNSPPMVVSLMPDKMSPQEAGTTIKWTGAALDPEKDPIQYKFLLEGQQKTDWSYDHTWSWITSNFDIGSHTLEIKVKDGNHNVDGDDSGDIEFTISTPKQPPSINELTPSPDSPQPAGTTIAWVNRAHTLASLGRNEEALMALEKAIELDPKNATIWASKAYTLAVLFRNEEALMAAEKAIELDPKNTYAWTSKAYTLVGLGRNEEALMAAEKAIELDPKNTYAWTSKAYTLVGLGRNEEALMAAEKAIELDPKNAFAWVNKDFALKALGRTTEANAAFAKAKELGYKG